MQLDTHSFNYLLMIVLAAPFCSVQLVFYIDSVCIVTNNVLCILLATETHLINKKHL